MVEIPGFSRIYPIKDSQNFYLNANSSQIWKFVNYLFNQVIHTAMWQKESNIHKHSQIYFNINKNSNVFVLFDISYNRKK